MSEILSALRSVASIHVTTFLANGLALIILKRCDRFADEHWMLRSFGLISAAELIRTFERAI